MKRINHSIRLSVILSAAILLVSFGWPNSYALVLKDFSAGSGHYATAFHPKSRRKKARKLIEEYKRQTRRSNGKGRGPRRGELPNEKIEGDNRKSIAVGSPSSSESETGRKPKPGIREAREEVDELISKGEFSKALSKSNELINSYGERPELTLLRSLAKIGQTTSKLGPSISKTIPCWSAQSERQCFNQINEFIKNNVKVPTGGRVSVAREGKGISVNYELAHPPKADPVGPGDIKGNTSVFLRDNPGSNNLDCHIPMDKCLNTLISGKWGKGIKLDRKDVADYNPTKIYVPDVTSKGKPSYRLVPYRRFILMGSATVVLIALKPTHCPRGQKGVIEIRKDKTNKERTKVICKPRDDQRSPRQ